MGLIDKLKESAKDGRMSSPADEQLEKSCPLLWELLTVDHYADGSQRVLPTIVMDRVPGGFQITLQDHETWQQLSVVVLTYRDGPKALEKALADPGAIWRPYKSYRQKQGLKKFEDKKA